eukprot:5840013-Pyramimonas_sp.AAC.1
MPKTTHEGPKRPPRERTRSDILRPPLQDEPGSRQQAPEMPPRSPRSPPRLSGPKRAPRGPKAPQNTASKRLSREDPYGAL